MSIDKIVEQSQGCGGILFTITMFYLNDVHYIKSGALIKF